MIKTDKTVMIQANELSDVMKSYRITRIGSVFNKKNNKQLKLDLSTGYARVTLSYNKTKKKFSVHRLVASIFILNKENKPCVNHINGIKSDNRVENLEWCTYSENEKHSHKELGKVISHNEIAKLKMSKAAKGRDMSKAVKASSKARKGTKALNRLSVVKCDLNNNELREYESYTEAAKDVNGVVSAFGALKKGRLKTYKGFKWRFKN